MTSVEDLEEIAACAAARKLLAVAEKTGAIGFCLAASMDDDDDVNLAITKMSVVSHVIDVQGLANPRIYPLKYPDHNTLTDTECWVVKIYDEPRDVDETNSEAIARYAEEYGGVGIICAYSVPTGDRALDKIYDLAYTAVRIDDICKCSVNLCAIVPPEDLHMNGVWTGVVTGSGEYLE